VRFSGKVTDGVNIISRKYFFQFRGITDIRFLENVSRLEINGDVSKIFRIARVSQTIHINYSAGEIIVVDQAADKITADESAAACYQ
jgi:hypothetical protein